MFLSFITESGIIPRNCPQFSKILKNNDGNNLKDNLIENNKENEKDIKQKENINNENNEKQIKNNKNVNDDKEIIPRIFTERKCISYNIIGPSFASHCRICDNCVQGFDPEYIQDYNISEKSGT